MEMFGLLLFYFLGVMGLDVGFGALYVTLISPSFWSVVFTVAGFAILAFVEYAFLDTYDGEDAPETTPDNIIACWIALIGGAILFGWHVFVFTQLFEPGVGRWIYLILLFLLTGWHIFVAYYDIYKAEKDRQAEEAAEKRAKEKAIRDAESEAKLKADLERAMKEFQRAFGENGQKKTSSAQAASSVSVRQRKTSSAQATSAVSIQQEKKYKSSPLQKTTSSVQLVQCRVCTGKVATDSPTCPHCGTKAYEPQEYLTLRETQKQNQIQNNFKLLKEAYSHYCNTYPQKCVITRYASTLIRSTRYSSTLTRSISVYIDEIPIVFRTMKNYDDNTIDGCIYKFDRNKDYTVRVHLVNEISSSSKYPCDRDILEAQYIDRTFTIRPNPKLYPLSKLEINVNWNYHCGKYGFRTHHYQLKECNVELTQDSISDSLLMCGVSYDGKDSLEVVKQLIEREENEFHHWR